jgi:adenosylhomocysteine nucleosidase
MRILVTFATDAEFAQWRSRHPFVPYELDDSGQRREFDVFRANVGQDEVTVLLTGIGGENTKKAMSTIPLEMQDLCISAGLAGALDGNLKIREIVVGRTAQNSDHSQESESDVDLVGLANACGARVVNVFLTSRTIVVTADEKRSLSAFGSVVEMETGHILAIARQRKVPAVGVRAISDAADEDLPLDFGRIADSRGHVKVGALLRELALHPHRLPLLVRFGHECRSAAGALADFLDQYIPTIAKQWHKFGWTAIQEASAT